MARYQCTGCGRVITGRGKTGLCLICNIKKVGKRSTRDNITGRKEKR